ncbi:MAG: glycosyltransferase [Oxalobacter sp.]|nr:glycosyltransferase [Oxalobacter sp.]
MELFRKILEIEEFTPESLNELIKELQKRYANNEIGLSQYIEEFAPSLRIVPRKIKTIGILHTSYAYGGAQRVMSLQIPMFLEMGYRVVLITERIQPAKEYGLSPEVARVLLPKNTQEDRPLVIARAIVEHSIDYLLHLSLNRNLIYDLLTAKKYKIPVSIYRHSTTVALARNLDRRLSYIHKICMLAERVFVLSTATEAYYRFMGCRAVYVQNPFEYNSYEINDVTKNKTVLWIGRPAMEKQFNDALRIMKAVVEKIPDAKMIILGGDKEHKNVKSIQKFITDNNLSNNIEWHAHTKNPEEFYKNARVHLLTSRVESFCLVIAESKSYGVPLVTYDLSYLELLRDGKGYISVPHNDINKAVDAVVRLLTDDDLCKRMSRDAHASVAPFLNFDMRKKWHGIINDIENNCYNFDYSFDKDSLKVFISSMLDNFQLGVRSKSRALASSASSNKVSIGVNEKVIPVYKEKFSFSKYLKYAFFSKITFGNKKRRYLEKYNRQKELYQAISQ